jgi:hypothetical protein
MTKTLITLSYAGLILSTAQLSADVTEPTKPRVESVDTWIGADRARARNGIYTDILRGLDQAADETQELVWHLRPAASARLSTGVLLENAGTHNPFEGSRRR